MLQTTQPSLIHYPIIIIYNRYNMSRDYVNSIVNKAKIQ